jgi:GNAT superfamily N-acetyltransferase
MAEILRVGTDLPAGMTRLAEVAAAEGVRNMQKLVADWQSGAQRFDAGAAALFAAIEQGDLAGVGGVKPETGAGESAMRMHRFYVHPSYRRLGIAKRIAHAAMSHAGNRHAPRCSPAMRAPVRRPLPFWEAHWDLHGVDAAGYTHIFRSRDE